MKNIEWFTHFLKIHSGLAYFFLYLPIIVLIVFSFNQEKINVLWTGFTLDWYREIFSLELTESQDLFEAVKNSLLVAGISTLFATILGTLVAFGMTRYNFLGKQFFDAVLQLPIVVPDVVMAISLLSFFVAVKPLLLGFLGFHFELGLITVIIAHISFNISFVAIVVRSRLQGFNLELEKAAQDLGATPLQAFFRVTLPLIWPGILAGALLAFTLSWDDFMIAFFTTGTGSTTLPIKVYSMIKFGISPKINAISTITLLFTISLVLISLRLAGSSSMPSSKKENSK